MAMKDLTQRGRSAMDAARQRLAAAPETAAAATAEEAVADAASTQKPAARAAASNVALTSPGAAAFYRPVIEEANRRAAEAQAAAEQLRAQLAAAPGELELDQLVEVPGRRRQLMPQEYAELRENLKENVLVHPVVVRQLDTTTSDGRRQYEVVSGGNRLAVFRELARPTIAVRVIDLDPGQADDASFWANLLQPSLSDYERFRGLQAVRDRLQLSTRDLARQSGLSQSLIHALMCFERLPAQALQQIQDAPRCIGAGAVSEIVQILAAHPERQAVFSEIIAELAAGRMTQVEGLQALQRGSVSPKAVGGQQRVVQASTIQIRSGRTPFCKIVTRGAAIRVEFADEAIREKADALIEQALRELAAKDRA